ncbi:NAD-dependent 4,6-dehydratase LegB [Alicyclobacillus fastidiosus]|uniref:NAD-dependent 4,6-dehydratase LegB n=1 Tax=Alicyclobacillus fastidiosus TaxID=392011 RepID=A0ABY6ZP15_9BACL|nr:NAD-dependent 4,6-dehydratase LegB [Alicyclobacillus fastidiosus]
MKTLVTGSDGFIGSHLVEELVCRGCHVKALAFYNSFGSSGWLEYLPSEVHNQVEIVFGDIRDADFVMNVMRGCQVVFHLAALVGIPYSYQAPASYVDTNVRGTLHVLQAAQTLGTDRVIHTSTSEVYGTAQFVPITESHPLRAQSPYAATKIGADQLALSFHDAFGAPVSIVRPFNTFGPRQSLRAVIPTIISQIASGNRKLKLGALHPTRDFTYVKDTVRGFTAIAEADTSVGKVVNVGSNYEISIAQLVQLIADVMGVHVEVETESTRLRPAESEVERLWADNSLARTYFGWTPHYVGRDGLRSGLKETADWFINEDNLKHYHPQRYGV